MSLPEELTIDLPGGVPMTFRRILDLGEVGEFRMGARGFSASEEPVHRVRLTVPFYLGIYPVTQRQYRAMAERCEGTLRQIHRNEGADPSDFKGDDRPVENVSCLEAEAVCRWLAESMCFRESRERFGLSVEWTAGLPTEAQWEYACRAGTETEYGSGDGEAALAGVAWYGKELSDGHQAVGSLKPNNWGLYDMHGNVWEWCRDVWDGDAYAKRANGVTDPVTESVKGDDERNSQRVLRGGSWGSSAGICRSAFRIGVGAADRVRFLGFRVCLFPGPVAAGGRGRKSKAERSGAGERSRERRDGAEGAENGQSGAVAR